MAPKKKGATASKKKIQIPADLREKLEVTFGEFSTDGKMTEEELQLALAALGIEPKDEEIKEIIKPFARRGMTLTKFIEIASEKVVNKRDPQEELRMAFQLMDKEGQGYLTVEDLRSVADELNEVVTDEDLELMMETADPTSSGRVNLEQFVSLLLQETST